MNKIHINNCDCRYDIKDHSGRHVLIIEDLDLGNKSVTNSISEIVDYVSKLEGLDLKRSMIVYRDSMGKWDGWDATDERFIPLNEDHWAKAVDKYIYLQLYSTL